MLRSLGELDRYTVSALGENIGTVFDFYFDDFNWTIRYLVVDTGDWLKGRKVLISPVAIHKVDDGERILSLEISPKMVQGSPDISTEKPVSRQYEAALIDYYDWPYYWKPGEVPGFGTAELMDYPLRELSEEIEEKTTLPKEHSDPHLRNMGEVIGYTIQARDGAIGHVEDFIVGDEDWKILYMIVDTGNWFSGKKVLVSPQWIEQVRWPEADVIVDLSRETVKDSPEFKSVASLDRDYEQRLYEHYGRRGYW
jgi:uncharacterized protein YrrD